MADARIKVLVVDDSVVIRKVIGDIVASAPDLELVGTASGGRLALNKIPLLNPDVITLDVEMPDMDGLTTLREIHPRWPRLPVIMCSSLTERGASTTLDALAAGARDYVAKPASSSDDSKLAHFPTELLRKIRLHGRPAPLRMAASTAAAAAAIAIAAPKPRPRAPMAAGQSPVSAIVIGSSTGGPNALADVMAGLPHNLRMPILIVQHMPPVFTRLLAERLARSSTLPVSEAKEGEPLLAGHVYVAPGNQHLLIGGTRVAPKAILGDGPPENSCRPSVDVLFASAAEMYGSATLAVVLTGMGQDGLRGAEQLRGTGAQILVQDEESSVVWGMPGAVYEHGLADEIAPLAGIAAAITRRVGALG